jgi:phosphate transport system substrate-binding protein
MNQRMTRAFSATAAVLLLAMTFGGKGFAADISIVGSSTVYPFMHHAAAVFGARAGKKIALEPTGTESGFDYFCAGTAKHMPDMNNASFAMTRPQFNNCRRNGVRDVLAFRIGFDGIVVFSAAAGPLNGLSLDALYRALAAEPVGAGTWALNKTRLWSEIDPRLAAEPIHVLGPPPTSGTRAFIEHEVLLPTCERLMGRPLSNIQQQSRCRAVRRDGPYIEVSEDDQFLINAALQSRHSIGLVGYGHFQQAGDSIKALTIDGVAPTYRDIASGDYPLSRPLFIYVKLTSLERKPEIVEFLKLLLSDEMMGAKGGLAKLGLISPSPEAVEKNRSTLANSTIVTCPSEFCTELTPLR